MLFTIQIFASLTALIASYAFLMTILKKETNVTWLRGEAVLILLSSGISFGLYYTNILSTTNYLAFISSLLLLISTLLALITVITQKLRMRKDNSAYPEDSIPKAKLMGIVVFGVLTAHLLLEIASLAWA
jgi:hypothetical protein